MPRSKKISHVPSSIAGENAIFLRIDIEMFPPVEKVYKRRFANRHPVVVPAFLWPSPYFDSFLTFPTKYPCLYFLSSLAHTLLKVIRQSPVHENSVQLRIKPASKGKDKIQSLRGTYEDSQVIVALKERTANRHR